MTNREALLGISGYPLPARTVETIARRRGLDLDLEAEDDTLNDREFRLSEADILMWLSRAPNVSQGGMSYSFTEEQRKDLKARARATYAEFGESNAFAGVVTYGYKGQNL